MEPRILGEPVVAGDQRDQEQEQDVERDGHHHSDVITNEDQELILQLHAQDRARYLDRHFVVEHQPDFGLDYSGRLNVS